MQVREVLRILQNKENISLDLKDKSVRLAVDLIELVGLAKGKKAKLLAEKQILSGDAWKYMQKLIKAQNAIHKRQLDLKNILYL
jgi:thymidine phosphorylase